MKVFRIVVVEDNPADVLLLEEALKQHGVEYTLEHFSNGEEAAGAISAMREPPALFILDLNVPRIYGLELLRLIRETPAVAGAPVAILTSSQAPADKIQSQQLGASAYIVKPMGFQEFVANVGGPIVRLLRQENAAGGAVRRCSHAARQPARCIIVVISPEGIVVQNRKGDSPHDSQSNRTSPVGCIPARVRVRPAETQFHRHLETECRQERLRYGSRPR